VKHIVIPGGTGYLGRNLARCLTDRGHRVTVLTRGRPTSGPTWAAVHWDGKTVDAWAETLEGADAVVHMSGKRVDCRPTKRNIDELIDSRVSPVSAVGDAWKTCRQPPTAWIQLSSLAGFGDAGDDVIDEDTQPPSIGFRQMVEVCRRWEAAFETASLVAPRTVLLRPSIAIGPGDPASRRLAGLARFGLGGRVGSGRQWVSWVGLDDCISVILRAIDSPEMSGLYHVTSPNPVQNKEMMAIYREAVGRAVGLPSPAFVTQVGAWILGSDPALALTGRRGVPTRLLQEGFSFATTSLRDAVSRALRGVL
jgi:uncharacterized protein